MVALTCAIICVVVESMDNKKYGRPFDSENSTIAFFLGFFFSPILVLIGILYIPVIILRKILVRGLLKPIDDIVKKNKKQQKRERIDPFIEEAKRELLEELSGKHVA